MEHAVERRRGGGGAVAVTILIVFIALVAAGTWGVYQIDEGLIVNGRGVEELALWEVVLGVILGIMGAVIGILGGLIGVVIGLAAAALALLLAAGGIAVGLFVTLGTILGPFLLLAAIIMLFRRGGKSSNGAVAVEDLSVETID